MHVHKVLNLLLCVHYECMQMISFISNTHAVDTRALKRQFTEKNTELTRWSCLRTSETGKKVADQILMLTCELIIIVCIYVCMYIWIHQNIVQRKGVDLLLYL